MKAVASRRDVFGTGAASAALLMACGRAAGARADTVGQALRTGAARTTYRTVEVGGLRLFYREAGLADAPVVLLLHGFPTSSRMFEPLFPRLSDRYRLVAPDYPGFGHSDAPPREDFAYTFDNIAAAVQGFTDALHLDRYVLYLQDYGGPVGMRLAQARPERVAGLVIQNAVAHEEGLDDRLWAPRRAFWADRDANEARLRAGLISPEATRLRHVGTSPHPERYDPDLWTDETAFLARPGQVQIQSDLFYDYRTNVASYPAWQAWLREHRPPALVAWGRYDPSFAVAGAEACRRDLPDAEIHLLHAGHFALDEAADEVAALMRDFLGRLPGYR